MKNIEKIRQTATQGDAEAQFELGYKYVEGEEIEQDYQEAFKWYKQAADQGYAKGQYSIGVMYMEGQGLTQDFQEALKWFRLAADQRLAPAQTNIGLMYAKGLGVTRDYHEAAKWYRLAAEQGEVHSQYNLGSIYAQGRGVTQDNVEAVKWFGYAALQGNTEAQYGLGLMYLNGLGIEKDYVVAYMWINLSADQATADLAKECIKTRDHLTQLMTEAQIKEAKQLTPEKEIDRRALKHSCYCKIWNDDPEHFIKKNVPVGYCGRCQICDKPGHIRHFPGAAPYTGSWCDRHYLKLKVFNPLGSIGIWIYIPLLITVVSGIIYFFGR